MKKIFFLGLFFMAYLNTFAGIENINVSFCNDGNFSKRLELGKINPEEKKEICIEVENTGDKKENLQMQFVDSYIDVSNGKVLCKNSQDQKLFMARYMKFQENNFDKIDFFVDPNSKIRKNINLDFDGEIAGKLYSCILTGQKEQVLKNGTINIELKKGNILGAELIRSENKQKKYNYDIASGPVYGQNQEFEKKNISSGGLGLTDNNNQETPKVVRKTIQKKICNLNNIIKNGSKDLVGIMSLKGDNILEDLSFFSCEKDFSIKIKKGTKIISPNRKIFNGNFYSPRSGNFVQKINNKNIKIINIIALGDQKSTNLSFSNNFELNFSFQNQDFSQKKLKLYEIRNGILKPLGNIYKKKDNSYYFYGKTLPNQVFIGFEIN